MIKGRKEPYTELGIKRVPCSRCGKASTSQWQVCANNNRYMGICTACDIKLNKLVLEFMNIANSQGLIIRYRENKR